MQDLVLIILYLALFVFTLWLFDVKRKIERLVTFMRDNPQVVHASLAVIIVVPVVIWFIYAVWWQGVKLILGTILGIILWAIQKIEPGLV